MAENLSVDIRSEIGELESVIIHTPGAEVENMTPENAERALYSDILNLNIGLAEYSQLQGVLSNVARTFEVRSLLEEVVGISGAREELVLFASRTRCSSRKWPAWSAKGNRSVGRVFSGTFPSLASKP